MTGSDQRKPQRVVAGKYRIVRLFGEGGMGEVYEAENVWTGRRVALKVLLKELANDPEIVERFVQEGRSTTMIPHPNIVDVLDMGREGTDGDVYMVQEFLTGMGLDRLLERKASLPVRDTLDILVPIMGGLVAAHRRGVVHRDVKPENIILAQTPRGSIVPKLIDFGVAKLVGQLRKGKTERGAMLGTPHYMSPEQLEGAEQVDHRTDVWAVGVMLYEMLSGTYPFDADSLPKLFIEICNTTPRFLKEVAPEVPAPLCELIHRALIRDPAQRYDSMEAFIDALLSCRALGETATWLARRHGDAIPYHREHPRFAVHWSCEIVCDQWQRALSLVSDNVSRGGVFVPSHRTPSVGSEVQVELRLPDGSHLRLRGEVLRVVGADAAVAAGSAGFAVRFAEEHATDLLVLDQIASAHQEPGYEHLPDSVRDSVLSISEVIEPIVDGLEGAPSSDRSVSEELEMIIDVSPPEARDTDPRGPTTSAPIVVAPPTGGAGSSRGAAPPAPIVDAPQRGVAAPTSTRRSPSVVAKHGLASAAGIDFGTTFGSISLALDDKVYAIPDAKQRTLHPSVVCYPQRGQPIVGWEARRYQLHEPQRTVTSVKRVLGRAFDEPLLQGYLHGLPVKALKAPEGDILFEVDKTQVAPIQVAAEQLDFLRRLAEARTGWPLEKVVISVPVTFGERQQKALRRAAMIAGLEVLELISEPVAAVTAYGFGQGKRETVAVYDFGGGTFDFSVLELDGNEHNLLTTGGDAWLGGEDFDMAIAQEAANRFWRETKSDLRLRAVEWQRLLFASEQAKRNLGPREATELVVPRAIEHPEVIDLRWTITRKDLERLCGEIVARTLEVCRRSLETAGLTPDGIDRIVITGGTTRIPFLQREVGRYFGKEVTAVIDPELSVCIGTGLRAAVLTNHRVSQAASRK